MDESRTALLRQLIASPSPSGFEQPVQKIIRGEIQKYSDEVRTDIHGNVIAALHASGSPRVMLTAHCDEIGFMIRYIDDRGFLYFAPIGGYDPATLPGERIQIHTADGPVLGVIGSKPIHLQSHDERGKVPRLSEMWFDIGVSSREEAQQLITIGSVATRAVQLEVMRDNLVVSRALDDKAGVFSVIEAMRRIHEMREKLTAGVFFVSAVQEEVGSRGARTGAFDVDPLIAIAVDVTFTSDHPHTSKHDIGEVNLNGGPVITIGGRINPHVYRMLVEAANEAGMAYQIDPQGSSTGTDADSIQVSRSSVATGLLNIPLRYMHTGSEIASLKDMDEVSDLIARFVMKLDAQTNVIP